MPIKDKPKTANEKYSGGPKSKAIFAKAGAIKKSKITLI
ncbi:unnamed protein product, partial [marine sediment metagenome]